MGRLRRIGFDLRAETSNVGIDHTPITEVVVTPNVLEKKVTGHDSTGVPRQLTQEKKLDTSQRNILAGTCDPTLLGGDEQISEHHRGRVVVGKASATQQGSNSSGQLLDDEWLGHVVVCTGLETSDHVVGIVTRSDDDYRDVARLTDRPAQVEPARPGKHDVHQHEIGTGRG